MNDDGKIGSLRVVLDPRELFQKYWIFLGYIFYMILVVAIAVAAVFYNPFVVLHEFYHHIRTKGGIHRGSDKNANKYAKSFLEAYNRITKQIMESHLER